LNPNLPRDEFAFQEVAEVKGIAADTAAATTPIRVD
jgi:hypothetical protein